VHSIGWWYVVGWCHLRQALRTFRVDRIAELNLTDTVFSIPANFDLRAYLAQEMQNTPQIRVRLRFAPQNAEAARYSRGYWETFEEQPDGAVLVTLVAPDPNWAVSSVLSYGPAVTVLDPPEIRQLVAEWALQTATQYSDKEQS